VASARLERGWPTKRLHDRGGMLSLYFKFSIMSFLTSCILSIVALIFSVGEIAL
jgi:hypothetical protein